MKNPILSLRETIFDRTLMIRRTRAFLLIWLSVASTSICQVKAQLAPNSRYQSIFSVGSAAPVGGQTFTSFSNVVFSQNGSFIGFEGFHTPFGLVDNGIFRYSTSSGAVNKIISKNDVLTNGGTFNMLFASSSRQLSVNGSGTVAFNGTIGGAAAAADTGWFYGSGGTITEMVREGNTAPGGGGTFGNFGTGILDIQFKGINDLNGSVFQTRVIGNPGGFLDDWRLFRVGPTPPVAIGVEGAAAPSGNYATFGVVEMNDVGGAVIFGSNAVTNVGNKYWYMSPSGTMSELVHITNAGPGGTGTAVGTLRATSGFPVINNQGDVVISGWTGVGGTGVEDTYIFRTSSAGGTPVVLLAENTAAPDGNGVFANIVLNSPHLNDAGQFASGLTLRSTTGVSTDDTGIFRVGFDGSVVQMFREGQAALSGNGTFGSYGGSEPFAFNNSGNVAMMTNYLGTSGGAADNTAIVISDGIDYFEIAREGKLVGSQTIASLGFSNGVLGNDRSTSGLNDNGQVAYTQNLTGTSNRTIELWTPDLHHRGGTSSFDDPTKWTLSLKPAEVHDVFIGTNNKSEVSLAGVQTVRNLTIGGNYNATLQVENGAQLNVLGLLDVKKNGTLILGPAVTMGIGSLQDTSSVKGLENSGIKVREKLAPGGDDIDQMKFAGAISLERTASTMIQLSGSEFSQYDSISGLSRLAIDGSLSVELIDGYALADNLQFQVFDVAGISTGIFVGLNEGAIVGSFGNHNLYISYRGGDGNDVSLFTTTAIPEPTTVTLLSLFTIAIFYRRRKS